MEGWIKIFRQLKDWEWYTNTNVKSLFIHCLLSANFKDKKWQGTVIKRGSFVTSLSHLADETGLTVQNVRTSLQKLIKTGELTKSSTSIYTVISVVKFELHQCIEDEGNKDTNTVLTEDQQGTNKVLTGNQQQLKKEKNDKNNKKDIINNIQKPSNFDDELFALFKEFLQMRKEIKKPFKSQKSLETRIKTLSEDVKTFGLENVKGAVINSISNQYQGIFVKGYIDNKPKEILVDLSYTPSYKLPEFKTPQERFMYFVQRFEAYRPKLENQSEANTTLRTRALMKKEAEQVCYELETRYPELTKIEI